MNISDPPSPKKTPKTPLKTQKNNKEITTLNLLTAVHWSVSGDEHPWCNCPVHFLQVVLQPLVLVGTGCKIVFSTQHDVVRQPKIITVPICGKEKRDLFIISSFLCCKLVSLFVDNDPR